MVWKELENMGYSLVPLKPSLEERVDDFRREVQSGPELVRGTREDFYEAFTPGAWYLFHVSHALRTVYLVAHAVVPSARSSRSPESLQVEDPGCATLSC